MATQQQRRRCRLAVSALLTAVAQVGCVLLAVCLCVGCTGHIGAGGSDGSGGDGGGAAVTCAPEGSRQDCYPGDPATRSIGECKSGTATCEGRVWGSCQGYVLPTDEDCSDGLDNNCDGVADEGCGCSEGQSRPCYTGPASTKNLGICSDGLQSCTGGVWSGDCVGQVTPAAEACDTLDNNCNGLIDDGCDCVDGTTQPCYSGPGGTKGVGVCVGGTQLCSDGAWGNSCQGEVPPSSEQCNGQDDDCDGNTDEGDPGGGGSCNSGQPGICAAGTKSCSGGNIVCNQDQQPAGEICDGLDNDCDGSVDNGNPGGGGSCSTGQPGVCGPGTQQCSGGNLGCVSNQQPSAEICDNEDNNCNGSTDEGNPGGGGSCSTGQPGVCGPGTLQCSGGSLNCVANQGPSAELCSNNLDDNCNGQVNEGCCGNQAPSATAAVNPGGGSIPPYDPPQMNNSVGESCTGYAWMSNSSSSAGWATLTWSSAKTVGSMYIDADNGSAPVCGSSGRNIQSAAIQYRNTNNQWVAITNVSGAENYWVTLPSPVQATAVRINNALSGAGNGNSIIFEWYVYPGSGCPTPTPN